VAARVTEKVTNPPLLSPPGAHAIMAVKEVALSERDTGPNKSR